MSVFGGGARGDAREGMTLISEEAYFHGSLVAKGSLRVDGTFEGDITDAVDVEVGAKGRVIGNIAAESLIVAGEVVGNVVASRAIELQPTAKLTGDMRAPRIRVDEGAFFDGACSMGSAEDKHRRKHKKADEASAPAEPAS